MAQVFGKSPVTSSEFPVVLFDAGGTLLHFNPPLEKLVEAQLEHSGHARSLEEIEKAWVKVLYQLNRDVEVSENFSPPDHYWLDHILRELKVPDFEAAKLRLRIVEAQTALRVVIAEPVIFLCDILKQRGYRLGVVSNWNERLPEIFRLQGCLDLFEVVICAAGRPEYQKPHAAPFREALEDLDVDPKNALFVGESFALDVIGAQRAGMKAVLYDPTYRELKALAESTPEVLSKVVSIDLLRQNRRLHGVKVITKLMELEEFLQ